jgi:glutamine transport system substrate-binding protein
MLALMASLAVILSACGQKNEEQSEDGASTDKTLRVVTNADYAPFESLEGDKVVGFDVDFVNALAKEAGYKAEIVHVGWDPIFVEIEKKTADMGAAAITMNDERKQSYDFSVPYFLSTVKILVPEGSTIKSAADLKGKTIAVQTATTGQAAVEKLVGKNDPSIKKFDNNNLAIQELLSGGADAVVADNTVLEKYVQNNPDQKLKVIEDNKQFVPEFYGLLFPKGSTLKSEFDTAVNTLFENGTYAELYQKWFGVEPDIESLQAQQ